MLYTENCKKNPCHIFNHTFFGKICNKNIQENRTLHCVQEKETKMFFVISPTKLIRRSYRSLLYTPTIWLSLSPYVQCVRKKREHIFFVKYSLKLRRFWWNLVNRVLNKLASKQCKRFPPHSNNVSTLPCETWNANCAHATVELLHKETPEFIPPQRWPPNSPDLITACGVCKRRCTKQA